MELDLELEKAREEVSWYFAASDAAMGLHGQTLAGEGGGPWDAARSNRAHMARRAARHRLDVDRLDHYGGTLGLLSAKHRADLALVYTPFGWGRLSGKNEVDKHAKNYCVYGRFLVGNKQMFALALVTEKMTRAYAQRHKERPNPTFEELIVFVADAISRLTNPDVTTEKTKEGWAFSRSHFLGPALREAVSRERSAVAAYSDHRLDRLARMKKDRIEKAKIPTANQKFLEKLRLEREEKDRAQFEALTGVRLERVA